MKSRILNPTKFISDIQKLSDKMAHMIIDNKEIRSQLNINDTIHIERNMDCIIIKMGSEPENTNALVSFINGAIIQNKFGIRIDEIEHSNKYALVKFKEKSLLKAIRDKF